MTIEQLAGRIAELQQDIETVSRGPGLDRSTMAALRASYDWLRMAAVALGRLHQDAALATPTPKH